MGYFLVPTWYSSSGVNGKTSVESWREQVWWMRVLPWKTELVWGEWSLWIPVKSLQSMAVKRHAMRPVQRDQELNNSAPSSSVFPQQSHTNHAYGHRISPSFGALATPEQKPLHCQAFPAALGPSQRSSWPLSWKSIWSPAPVSANWTRTEHGSQIGSIKLCFSETWNWDSAGS